MFFPILLILTTLGATAILLTHDVFEQVYRKKQRFIALDNFLIQLGRLDRKWLPRTEEKFKALQQLDQKHHVAHACRFTNPQCWIADKALEATIQIEAMRIKSILDLEWPNLPRTLPQASHFTWRRERLHYRIRDCPYCHLKNQFVFERFKYTTAVHFEGLESDQSVQKKNLKWNYQLHAKSPTQ